VSEANPGGDKSKDRPDGSDLPRRLGVATITFVTVASMVGSGVLTTSGGTIASLQNHYALLIVWTIGALLAFLGALAVAEPATAFPRAGGEYVYVREAFGDAIGFALGFATLTIGFFTPIAIISLSAADHLIDRSWFDSLGSGVGIDVAKSAAATALIVAFTVIHSLGQTESALTQNVVTVAKIALLVAPAVAGLLSPNGRWDHFSKGVALGDVSLAACAAQVIVIHYSYFGWTGGLYLAGEAREPRRTLPIAALIGCAVTAGLYLMLNLMYAYAIDPKSLVGVDERD
jgi:APA family basic amino acid/polyamine antiporter